MMKASIPRSGRLLARPLDASPRLLLLAAAILLLPVLFAPLWRMTLTPPGNAEPLGLDLYSYKLAAGRANVDLEAINRRNDAIGMRRLSNSDFAEFKWMPFVIGAFGLLLLRGFLIGSTGTVVDLFVIYLYFCLFALWSFAYRLSTYGHDLAPGAAVKVAPFMPPLLGERVIAGWDVRAAPGPAAFALAGAAVVLAIALATAWKQARAEEAAEARTAG